MNWSWQATFLGVSLPASSPRAAIDDNQLSLFLLSVPHIRGESPFPEETIHLFPIARDNDAGLVAGGRVLNESVRKRMKSGAFCDTMLHFENYSPMLSVGS
ncbi:MAG: hypothetical protein MK102_17640 [Fuerstiella sp.]|nr:hypothetical protein [Fuerstiella sp.]